MWVALRWRRADHASQAPPRCHQDPGAIRPRASAVGLCWPRFKVVSMLTEVVRCKNLLVFFLRVEIHDQWEAS